MYGNADLDKELAFINEQYLAAYEKSDAEVSFALQEPFDQMKKVTEYYPISEGTDTTGQSYLSLSLVCGKNTDQKLRYALDILSDVLINQESAPVRLALQKAEIGRDVSAFIDPMKQMVFQIRVQNADPAQDEQFKSIVRNTLQQVVEEGVDSTAVRGTLNRLEFRKREGMTRKKV
ncbi:MAG: insulinase family protein [candidate division KSB1 bacterium]|nr:insulinase family protein [candidate division KSB1 bacterium]